MLPVAVMAPEVSKSAPVMLPTAEIRPLTLRLPLVTLPVITTVFEDFTKVKAGLPARISLSLNCTCVLAPPASMLPNMLPIKYGAVMLPEAETMPVVLTFPACTLPAVSMLPPVMLPVTVAKPPVLRLPPSMLAVAETVVAVTLPTNVGAVTLPVADTSPVVRRFAACMLPPTVSKLATLSNVKAALAPRRSPVSLNCT